jgi:hypothetical protein
MKKYSLYALKPISGIAVEPNVRLESKTMSFSTILGRSAAYDVLSPMDKSAAIQRTALRPVK